MDTIEIKQKDTVDGWWAVVHNDREVYSSDVLGNVINWLRHYSGFSSGVATVSLTVWPIPSASKPLCGVCSMEAIGFWGDKDYCERHFKDRGLALSGVRDA